MTYLLHRPIQSLEDANAALEQIDQWPDCAERDDRLLEAFAYRTDHLWRIHALSAEQFDGGQARVGVVLRPKRMLVVKTRPPGERGIRIWQELIDDKIIDWHPESFFAHATSENLMGSMHNANLFRRAFLQRLTIPRDRNPNRLIKWIARPIKGVERQLDRLMTPEHRIRRECGKMAAELSISTPSAPSLVGARRF